MLFSMNIKKDNYKFDLDKKAHYSTSFGLYYFFFTYVNEIMLATLLSILTGLFFEIYQGYSKHHSGYSHVDMVYNIFGVLSALILHKITLL